MMIFASAFTEKDVDIFSTTCWYILISNQKENTAAFFRDPNI